MAKKKISNSFIAFPKNMCDLPNYYRLRQEKPEALGKEERTL